MNISCVLNACGSRFPESETLAVFGALDREYRSTEQVTRRNKLTRFLDFHRPPRVAMKQQQPQPDLSQQMSRSQVG